MLCPSHGVPRMIGTTGSAVPVDIPAAANVSGIVATLPDSPEASGSSTCLPSIVLCVYLCVSVCVCVCVCVCVNECVSW